MKKEWFEPGPDGEIPFVKAALNTTAELPVWETISAAFRALLAEDEHDERDALINQLRGEVERLQGELQHCNHMNRDLTTERERLRILNNDLEATCAHLQAERDAARAEVERLTHAYEVERDRANEHVADCQRAEAERDALQASLRDEQAKRASIEAELAACRKIRDALQARIDAGVRAWENWKQQCGSLWLWAFPGATASQALSDVCDALDADYVVYPIAEVDERKGERRQIKPRHDDPFRRYADSDRRRTLGTIADRKPVDERTGKADRRETSYTRAFKSAQWTVRGDTGRQGIKGEFGDVAHARSNCRRVTPGTRADRRQA